jgi:hypothetical protein
MGPERTAAANKAAEVNMTEKVGGVESYHSDVTINGVKYKGLTGTEERKLMEKLEKTFHDKVPNLPRITHYRRIKGGVIYTDITCRPLITVKDGKYTVNVDGKKYSGSLFSDKAEEKLLRKLHDAYEEYQDLFKINLGQKSSCSYVCGKQMQVTHMLNATTRKFIANLQNFRIPSFRDFAKKIIIADTYFSPDEGDLAAVKGSIAGAKILFKNVSAEDVSQETEKAEDDFLFELGLQKWSPRIADYIFDRTGFFPRSS